MMPVTLVDKVPHKWIPLKLMKLIVETNELAYEEVPSLKEIHGLVNLKQIAGRSINYGWSKIDGSFDHRDLMNFFFLYKWLDTFGLLTPTRVDKYTAEMVELSADPELGIDEANPAKDRIRVWCEFAYNVYILVKHWDDLPDEEFDRMSVIKRIFQLINKPTLTNCFSHVLGSKTVISVAMMYYDIEGLTSETILARAETIRKYIWNELDAMHKGTKA